MKEPETPALDWCSPSDQVWTAVSKEVFPPKDRRVFAWWWVGLGLVLIGAIMFIYFVAAGSVLTSDIQSSANANKQQILSSSASSLEKNNIAHETTSNGTILELGDSQIEVGSKDQAGEEDETLNDETLAASTSNAPTNLATARTLSQKMVSPSYEDNARGNLLKSESTSNANANTKSVLPAENELPIGRTETSEAINKEKFAGTLLGSVQPIAGNDQKDMSSIEAFSKRASTGLENALVESSGDKIVALSKLGAGILNAENEVELKPFVEKPIELLNSSAYSWRISSGAFEWNHNISDAFTNDLSAFDFNYLDSYGVFIRLDLQRSVSPLFAFAIGVELDRVKIESGHNSLLDYLLDDEVGGLKENDYKLDLATPYGLMPASFKFFRDDALASDANLLVDFNNEHLIYNLRSPITFTLTPFRRMKKWQLGLDAGLGFNYIAQLSNRAQSIVTNHSQIHLQDSSVTLSDQNIKRFHLDVFGAAFVERRFNDRWALRMYYEHNWGQSKLFELGAYHTKIDRRYFGIGLSKTFK